MNSKSKTLILLTVLSIVATLIANFLGDPEGNGLCQMNDVTCGNYYANSLGLSIFFFSLAFLITCLVLLFVREETYKSWRNFAYWAVPISIILLWVAPTSGPTGIGISFLNYTKESASWLVSGAFLVISLLIIIRKSFSR